MSLTGALNQVREFHEKFRSGGVPTVPEIPSVDIQGLCFNLIREEFLEFDEAWRAKDLVAIADALADLNYVVLYAALAYGIPLDKVFDEVHRTNMLKERATSEGTKIRKPEGWQPPNIKDILFPPPEKKVMWLLQGDFNGVYFNQGFDDYDKAEATLDDFIRTGLPYQLNLSEVKSET